jgi:hypothetical protein
MKVPFLTQVVGMVGSSTTSQNSGAVLNTDTIILGLIHMK